MIVRLWAAIVLAALILPGCATSTGEPRAEPAEVAVISAMHGLHRDHPGYDYDDLYALVAAYEPDLVGVEVRSEDMGRTGDYLARNYPAEMVALAQDYGERAFGFDWLGAELEGRAIPEGWWREGSEIKALERALGSDPHFTDRDGERLDAAQFEILQDATVRSLHDGRYDAVTREKYARLSERLAGTVYAPVSEFYAERDRQITETIRAMAVANPGARIVVVTGADHRAGILDGLDGDPRIRLLAVPPPQFDSRAPGLDTLLHEAEVSGAILIRRVSDGAEWTGGGDRVDERFVPASTFKIANSLILLEAGVITDPENEIIAWDGVERGGGWDQDQTLRLAFRRSAYWAYSALAREAGQTVMARSVALLGYGDEHIGGPDDAGTFWLEGPLSITAREQVGFLQRLHARALPVTPAHMETVIGFMEADAGEDWVLRGKTGWGQPEGEPDIGWFVGWLETETDTWLFAVNIDMTDPARHRDLRRELAEAALRRLGAYPG